MTSAHDRIEHTHAHKWFLMFGKNHCAMQLNEVGHVIWIFVARTECVYSVFELDIGKDQRLEQ